MEDYPFFVIEGGKGEKDSRQEHLEKVLQRAQDYQVTFGSEAGMRVLEDLFNFCLINHVCFAENPYKTAFNEGSRNVGLYIKAQMAFKPK
jgi:hypothetical protein